MGRTTNFGRYAAFYDALYADKDYAGECRYLERLFRRLSRRPVRSVLSLGCGTGNHDLLLAERGYRVTGVDRSPGMLAQYRRKARAAGRPVKVHRGDLRSLDLGERFDAVIAMFAVIGYQVTDRDLERALATAARHLRRGGILVFDVWYGPGVLRDPPGLRTKSAIDGSNRIVRRSESRLDEPSQTVEVRFRTERFAGSRRVERVEETHSMRYFFPRELSIVIRQAGLEPALLAPFGSLTGPPSAKNWSVTVVARA